MPDDKDNNKQLTDISENPDEVAGKLAAGEVMPLGSDGNPTTDNLNQNSDEAMADNPADDLTKAEKEAAAGEKPEGLETDIEKSENDQGNRFNYARPQTEKGKNKGKGRGKGRFNEKRAAILTLALGGGSLGFLGMALGPHMMFFQIQDNLNSRFQYFMPAQERFAVRSLRQKVFGGGRNCTGSRCQFQTISENKLNRIRNGMLEGRPGSRVMNIDAVEVSDGRWRIDTITINDGARRPPIIVSANGGEIGGRATVSIEQAWRQPGLRRDLRRIYNPRFETHGGRIWQSLRNRFGVRKNNSARELMQNSDYAEINTRQQELDTVERNRRGAESRRAQIERNLANAPNDAARNQYQAQLDDINSRISDLDSRIATLNGDGPESIRQAYRDANLDPDTGGRQRFSASRAIQNGILRLASQTPAGQRAAAELRRLDGQPTSDGNTATRIMDSPSMRRMNRTTNAMRIVCMGYSISKTVMHVSRGIQIGMLANQFVTMMSIIDRIRAGDGTPEDTEFLGDLFTRTTSYASATAASVPTIRRMGRYHSRTFTDSFGYAFAARGDLPLGSGEVDPSNNYARIMRTWQTGGGLIGHLTGAHNDNILAGTINVFSMVATSLVLALESHLGATATSLLCRSVLAGGLGVATDAAGTAVTGKKAGACVAGAIKTLGLSCIPLAIDLVGTILTASVIRGTITSHIERMAGNIEEEFRNAISSANSEEMANIMTSGAGVFNGALSAAAGNGLATREQAIENQVAMREVHLAFAEEDRFDRSPFDISSPNTFFGSIAHNIFPRFANITGGWSFMSAFSSILTGGLSTPMRAVASAANETAWLDFCGNSTLRGDLILRNFLDMYGDPLPANQAVAFDPFCNPVFAFPESEEPACL